MSNADMARRIKALEDKKRSNDPIIPGVVKFADTPVEIESAMDEFSLLPKNTPMILIHEYDASMPRPEKK